LQSTTLTTANYGRRVRLLTTGEVARELGVSRAAVLSWVRDGKLTPTLTTPGGHHRFDLDDVRRQLREQRQRGSDT
jgi:excisionase family DNA binding protein